ncbi:MAG: hypothetical protein ACJATN_002271 [Neolewinella sp.]|jgi:hypothetical protein
MLFHGYNALVTPESCGCLEKCSLFLEPQLSGATKVFVGAKKRAAPPSSLRRAILARTQEQGKVQGSVLRRINPASSSFHCTCDRAQKGFKMFDSTLNIAPAYG